MEKILKEEVTKYVLLELHKWYTNSSSNKETNDLSMLKSLKLFFLLSTVNLDKEDNLLNNVFDNYYAMPFGPVEEDVYNFFKNTPEIIDKESLKISNLSSNNDKIAEYKNIVDICIEKLKQINDKIITYSASQLVDLTHKYSSWITNYNKALANNSAKGKIPKEEIIKEEKFYFI